MNRKTKMVSFNLEDEKDLLMWAERQRRFSPYVKRLIRQDMVQRLSAVLNEKTASHKERGDSPADG